MVANPLTSVVQGPAPPWPVVPECHKDTDFHPGHTCPQHDGSHDHEWVAWFKAPEVAPGIVVVDKHSGPGLPVRCKVCGARKCDLADCRNRRHHRGPHLDWSVPAREFV